LGGGERYPLNISGKKKERELYPRADEKGRKGKKWKSKEHSGGKVFYEYKKDFLFIIGWGSR